jgi:hypothetical protein
MVHEVGESQKNSQMFCLGCDTFFKVKEKEIPSGIKDDDEALFNESVEALNETQEESLNSKIKAFFKKFLGGKHKKSEPEPEPEPAVLEADPPKMSEAGVEIKSSALIDDFLEPEVDFENEPEDVPAEYIDFLTVGLDISTSDLIENHAKNQSDTHSRKKEQE